MRSTTCLAGILTLALLAGCPVSSPTDTRSDRKIPQEPRGNEKPAATKIEPDRATDDNKAAGRHVTAPVPDELMASIIDDLATRKQARRADISVLSSETVIWRDGALGCPEPGQLYTEALVDGYWVVLGLDGARWDYRASRRGAFKLCQRSGQPPLPPESGESH